MDIVLDICGTSNYSFEHEDFLLNLVDSYIKDDDYFVEGEKVYTYSFYGKR